MRTPALLLVCLIALGCDSGANRTLAPPIAQAPTARRPVVVTTAAKPTTVTAQPTAPRPEPSSQNPHRWKPTADDKDSAVGPPPADNVVDLRQRKTGSDWSTFLGPHGTSVSDEKGLHVPWPAGGPRVVWFAPMGGGYVMPAISKGRAFLFDRGKEKMRLRCLNSETGSPYWAFEYPSDYKDLYGYDSGPRATPVVDGGRVYICGPEGVLHCVSVADGRVVWRVDTIAKFGVKQNFFGVGSAPVIDGNLLIVPVGGSPANSPDVQSGRATSNGTGVVAFDKYTGKVKYWVGDELAAYAAPMLATINGRRWCFVLARGGLLGLEPQTGKLEFHYPWRARVLESVNASTPVVVGDRVFISETYGPGSSLLKVKPGGYDVLWNDADKARDKSLQCHWNTPIHHDGYLYGCSGRHENNAELRCIELATGKVMWSEPNLTRTSLLMVDGHFVCLCENGQILLLKVNPKKFEVVSRIDLLLHPNVCAAIASTVAALPDKAGPLHAVLKHQQVFMDRLVLLDPPCWAAPILAHGLLYLRGKNFLVCMELIREKP